MQPPRRWSAPDLPTRATAGETFIASIAAGVTQIRANAGGTALEWTPEHLHQMRVGIRRLRSTLRAFRELIRDRPAHRFDRALRSAQHTLGVARDWDVFLGSQRDRGLRRSAIEYAAAARRRARATATSLRLRALLRRIRAWAGAARWRSGADPREPIAGFACRSLARMRRKLHGSAAGIDWREAKPRHRVRIQAKRLRYGSDCFAAAAWPERSRGRFNGQLRLLQDILGELNDIEVQHRLLKVIARHGDARIAALTVASAAKLRRRERALLKTLDRAWTAFGAIKPYWT